MTDYLEIEPDFAAPLASAGLRTFDDFMKFESAGPPSSKHAQRETVPVGIALDGVHRRFYLKRVFKVPPAHAIGPLLRFQKAVSQPLQEWRILGELYAESIPAMRRVACGERRTLGTARQAFLLVEEVPISHNLENWLIPGFPRPFELDDAMRRQMFRGLGRLVGRLHSRRFAWPDIHAKHIYAEPPARESGGAEWRFSLIDVERMRRLPDSLSAATLAGREQVLDRLFLSDLRKLERSLVAASVVRLDYLAFMAGYFESGPLSRPTRRDASGVRQQSRSNPWTFSPRLPDDFRHPRSISLVRNGKIISTAENADLLTTNNLNSLDNVFAISNGSPLDKPGLAAYRDRIRLQLRTPEGGERVCYLKRYRSPPIGEQLRHLLEQKRPGGPARAEADYMRRLGNIGLATMRGIATGLQMSGLFQKRSFLLTEEVKGESLEKLANRCLKDASCIPPPRDRHEIIRQLAFIVRRMHESRFFHRDLYLCHVFVLRNADNRIVLRLIDLARMIERPLFTQRWIIKDLAALEYSSPSPLITRADRLRFLYYYGRTADGSLSEFWLRQTMRRVRSRVARMTRHDRRRAERHSER